MSEVEQRQRAQWRQELGIADGQSTELLADKAACLMPPLLQEMRDLTSLGLALPYPFYMLDKLASFLQNAHRAP